MTTLTEIAGGRGDAIFGLSVAFPGGNTVRVSSSSFTSATGGHYTGKVLSWGRIPTVALSDRGGTMPTFETRVQIDDTDRTIARIRDGVYADTVRGSAAVIYLMTPSAASSSWNTFFTGVVAKVSFPQPFVAELTLRSADDRFQRPSPGDGWTLTRVAWPNAKAEVFDQVAPIVYGTHDASNVQTGPGFVPTLYVDTVKFRYLVSAARCKTLTRVYVDGNQVAAATYGSAFDYVTVNGRLYSCITFTSDQGDVEVTCDVVGYESVGDGSGTVISNPATQWAHWMSQFVFQDYAAGSWYSTITTIDSTTLAAAETYFTNIGATETHYSAERQTGADITAAYCKRWNMRSTWTPTGKIAHGYEDLWATPYAGTVWRGYRDETGPLNLDEDDFTLTTRLNVKTTYSASQGAYLASLDVVDSSLAEPLLSGRTFAA